MDDEILDYEWVTNHETSTKIIGATLFQQYFSEESLILATAMLYDNDFDYHVNVDNPERKEFGNLVHEIHIHEDDLDKANKLLGLLINEDLNYPIKKYQNNSLESLQFLLDENQNVYIETLVKIELKRRGIELTPPEEEEKGLSFIILFISIIFFTLLIYHLG